jgi:hypothetical protein
MAQAGEIVGVISKGHEAVDTRLLDEHHPVPAFVLGADQQIAAVTIENHRAATFRQPWQCVRDIQIIGVGAADRVRRGQRRRAGIVGNLAKTQEVEHDNGAGKASHHQGTASRLAGVDVTGH